MNVSQYGITKFSMISLRIDQNLEKKLSFFAKSKEKTRSEVIIQSISEYLQKHSVEHSAFELGKDLFGKYSSGKTDISKNRKKYLIEKIQNKHAKKRIN